MEKNDLSIKHNVYDIRELSVLEQVLIITCEHKLLTINATL